MMIITGKWKQIDKLLFLLRNRKKAVVLNDDNVMFVERCYCQYYIIVFMKLNEKKDSLY